MLVINKMLTEVIEFYFISFKKSIIYFVIQEKSYRFFLDMAHTYIHTFTINRILVTDYRTSDTAITSIPRNRIRKYIHTYNRHVIVDSDIGQ